MQLPSVCIGFLVINALACGNTPKIETDNRPITCTDTHCQGTYTGPEFIGSSDVAHQFSNTMARAVGDQLKVLYANQEYSRVDLPNIEMTTAGMGSGRVAYYLYIPFVPVAEKCDAYTSFDHVGGWSHAPELKRRINALRPALLPGDNLAVSDLKTTKEGLQEYWIQWRNKETQRACVE